MNIRHSTRDNEHSEAADERKPPVHPASIPPAFPPRLYPESSTESPAESPIELPDESYPNSPPAHRTAPRPLRQRRSVGKAVPLHVQYLRFGMVGVTNAVVDLGVLNLLLALHPTRRPAILLVDNTVAVTLAILNSYLWNTRWTFSREATRSRSEKLLFIAQGLLNIITNNLVLLAAQFLFQTRSGIWYIVGSNVAKLIAMIIASTLSFVLLRTVVFRARHHGPPPSAGPGNSPSNAMPADAARHNGKDSEAHVGTTRNATHRPERSWRSSARRSARPPRQPGRQSPMQSGEEPYLTQHSPVSHDSMVRGAFLPD